MSNKIESISVEGVNLPNKALTNFELLDAVKKLKIPNFRGIFMRNELPRRPLNRESGILNLDGVILALTEHTGSVGIRISPKVITFTSIPSAFSLLTN